MFLVRHGETEYNLVGRVQGRLDSSLTPRGLIQAEAIGRRLKTMISRTEDWRVESSPLGRAVATAEIIRTHTGISSEVAVDDRLREVSLGSWDGMTREEIRKRWPGAFGAAPSLRQSWVRACPDGESIDAAIARLADWLRSRHDHQMLIVISHGISGSLLRGIYAELPRDEMLRLCTSQDSFHQLVNGVVQDVQVRPVAT
jgi:broad specificity phosphatase PhoE